MPPVPPLPRSESWLDSLSSHHENKAFFFEPPKEIITSDELFQNQSFSEASLYEDGAIIYNASAYAIRAIFRYDRDGYSSLEMFFTPDVRYQIKNTYIADIAEGWPFVSNVKWNPHLISGLVHSCSVEDFNGDGLVDIAFRTIEEGGGEKIYVMYQLNYYGDLCKAVGLPEEYGPFLALASDKNPSVTNPEPLKAQVEIARAIEKRELPSEEKLLLLNMASHFLLDISISDFSSKQEEDEKWLGLYTGCMTKLVGFPEAEKLIDAFINLVRAVTSIGRNKKKDIKSVPLPSILNSVAGLIHYINNGRDLTTALNLLQFLLYSNDTTPSTFTSMADSVYKLAMNLPEGGLALIYGELRKKYYDIGANASKDIAEELKEAISEGGSKKCLSSVYKWLTGDSDEPNLSLVRQYEFLFRDANPPSYADIVYADKNLGVAGAKTLHEKFNLSHFERYSKSLLDHLFEMALNTNYKSDLPLIFVMVAKGDHNGAFDWGKHFDYNSGVRMVVVEIGSYYEFVSANEWVVKNYGVPDSIFITAHGRRSSMHLGSSHESINTCQETNLKKEIRKIYQERGPMQVVLNSCSVGASKENSDTTLGLPCRKKTNIAQMMANVFDADTYAPEAKVGTPWLGIDVENGIAHIDPLFLELDWSPINYGGTCFKPVNTKKTTFSNKPSG